MIPHNKPTFGTEEEEAALRVIRSSWVVQGPEVKSFEKEFCEYIGIPEGHAVAVSNGTAALFLSLWVMKANNKKVMFPSYVCSVLHSAVEMSGGHEFLVDVAKNSPNMDINFIKNVNSDIVIVPHMYGIPVDLSDVKTTHIIEDCAQALGAKVNGKSVGLQGCIGIFSFHATKLITSGGQGGMIVSYEKEYLDQIRDILEYGIQDSKIRFNFQMTDLQAAIGREQLKKLPGFLKRRSEIFNRYKEAGLELLDIDPKDVGKLVPARFRALMRSDSPKKIIDSLASEGIRATVLIEENGLLGDKKMFPNALPLTKKYVSLPIYPSLSDEDLEQIISILVAIQ